MLKIMDNRNGLALPAVIMIIIFLLIIGMGTLELGTMDMREAIKAENRMKAFYLAEAGGERALQIIKNKEDWENALDQFCNEPHYLGDGKFVVEPPYSEDDGSVTVISEGTVLEGTVQEQREKVELKITFPSGGGVFANGVFGIEKLDFKGKKSGIWGYDDSGPLDYTDEIIASTGGEIDEGEEDHIHGGYEENAEIQSEPVEIPSDLQNMPYTEELEGSISEGDYRFKDFSISGNTQVQIEGHVRMYVEDAFEVKGNADITLSEGAVLELYLGEDSTFDVSGDSTINEGGTPSNVAIYSASDKDIHLSGNKLLHGAIYAPEADFQLSGSSPLWGGVVAKKVSLNGNVQLYYDVALMEDIVPGDPGGGFVDWSKGEEWRRYFE